MQYDEDDALLDAYKLEIQFRPQMSNLKEAIKKLLIHYISEPDTICKFEELLAEFPAEGSRPMLILKMIEYSLEFEKVEDNERISRLLAYLGIEKKLFNYSDLAYAFDSLIWKIYSYKLDFPHAKGILAKYVTRAIADRVLPPRYLIEGEPQEHETEDTSEVEILGQAV